VRVAPAVHGVVVDSASGEPVPEAVVVVRFDGSHNDRLPDRDLLGFGEAVTDANGRFVAGPLRSRGVAIWPLLRIETRLAAVMHPGYRCAAPRLLMSDQTLVVELEPAVDADDMRRSCRPVSARASDAPVYASGWRALFPEVDRSEAPATREIERVLEARQALAFGQNCQGPVLDLSLAPTGRFAAVLVRGGEGPLVQAVEMSKRTRNPVAFVAPAPRTPPRRIGWVTPWELVLWEPPDRGSSDSPGSRAAHIERLWRAPGIPELLPAAPDPSQTPATPLGPADLNDEADLRWQGRAFSLQRIPDPVTGLAADRLHVVARDGSSSHVDLPGEACGTPGRFGRPHYRIAADGQIGVDLRFVDGGCHAVAIDLATGSWSRLDRTEERGTCQRTRRIPASQMALALRGYAREIEAGLAREGVDPTAPYALRIAGDAGVVVEAMDYAGRSRSFRAGPFPVKTPLHRIEVSVTGSPSPLSHKSRRAIPGPDPL
jgi:hypothetical protein